MNFFSRMADRTGALGTLASGMGCAACFPALAGIGATLGLGFLASWERTFITTLIPLFAVIALIANSLTWRVHRQTVRGLVSVTGPLLVLAGVAPFQLKLGQYAAYAQFVFYAGLVLMMVSALWNLVRPARRQCVVPVPARKSE